MTNRFHKIWRVLLIWLLLIVVSNLQLFGLYHLNTDIAFFILSHLCLLAIYLTFRKTAKKAGDLNPLLSKTNPLLSSSKIAVIILYLIFSICFWLHLNIIADFLIARFPAVFERFYDFAFQYSSQLKSTFLMLAANLAMWAVLVLSTWNGIRNVIQSDDDKPSTEIKTANLIWVSVLVLFCLIYFALLRHNTFHSKAWDLAIFAQLIDNFRHGVFFEANVRGVSNIFSDHFTPIIYIFSPFLYLWNDPSRLLLVVQALFITIGVIPTFLIARKRTNSPTAGFCMGVVYLLLPTLQYMNIFDFHPVVLSIPLMLFAWHFWESRRFGLMYLFLAFTMLCHEQMWIVVGALGLYLALFERERIRGIALAVIGWGGFLLLVLWFFPMFRGGEEYFYVHRYAYLGDSMGEIIKSILTKPQLWLPRLVSPQALMFIILMLLPVGFLPAWRPKYLLIILPTYFYSALSIESLQTSIFAQYAAPYVPFVIIASIYGLERISKRVLDNANKLVVFKCLGFIAVCAALIANAYCSPYIHGRAYQSQQFKGIWSLRPDISAINGIPKNASICAGSKYAPHLVKRDLYLLPDYKKAEYIVLDFTDYHDSVMHEKILEIFNQEYFVLWNSATPRIILRKVPEKQSQESRNISLSDGNCLDEQYDKSPLVFHRKKPNSRATDMYRSDAPIHMELGILNPVSYVRDMSAEFVKVRDTDELFFGVLIYPATKSRSLFYGQPPLFNIVRFWYGHKSTIEWEIGERLLHALGLPKGTVLSTRNRIPPLFLLMPIPEDYPNTLEEYITEMSIQQRWLGRIFHDNTIPKNGFRDEFEFVEYPDE